MMRMKAFTLIVVLSVCFTLVGSFDPVQAQSEGAFITALEGQVIDAQTGLPISGAIISVPELNVHLLADDNGRFSRGGIALGAESAIVSISVNAGGYGAWTMQNTRLYAGVTRTLGEIRLGMQRQMLDGGATLTITDDDRAAALESLNYLNLPEAYEPEFFSHEIIPSTIRVGVTGHLHCSDWLRAGQPVLRVIEMPFSEYIKNVLGNEWVSTWNVESLRAGAVAAKMFAWWRINLNVDGVRPQGAHVVNNTCDQVFIENSAQSSTSAAVDDTWNHIMRANGRVVEIHYLNTDDNCNRYLPNVRCMGQWGSKALADAGMGWQDILHHYYDPVQITLGSSNLPALPANTDVARNGDFSDSLREWSTFGEIGWEVADGVLAIKAESADDRGGVRQNIAYTMQAGSPLEITLQMGNTSGVTKTPRVVIRSSTDQDDSFACDFVIPPNTPLQQFVVYGLSGEWSIPRVEIWPDPADNLPNLLVDNLTIAYRPNLSISSTRCYAPEDNANWTFTTDPQGWTISSNLTNPAVTDDGIRYDVTGAFPALVSPTMTNVNAESATHVIVRMATDMDDCGAIYFKQRGQLGYVDGQQVQFEVLPDGLMHTYQVEMSAVQSWQGAISEILLAPACGGVPGGSFTLRSVTVADADSMPILQSPIGVVVEPLGNPMYRWRHLNGVTAYQLYIGTEAGQQVFYDYVDARQFCADGLCAIDLTTLDERYRLANGAHVAYLRAWSSSQPGDWAGEFTFTLRANAPAPASLTSTTDLHLSRPTFNWELRTGAEGATWFHLYVAPDDDLGNPVFTEWFTRAATCGSPTGIICGVKSPVDLANGRYSIYIQSWGPGGYSTGGILGWAGPGRFTINGPLPTLPENLRIELALGRPTLIWDDKPDFAWVQVYVGTPGGVQLHLDWHEKTPAMCDGTICRLTPALTPVSGAYVVYMQVWGAGGLSGWGGPVTAP